MGTVSFDSKWYCPECGYANDDRASACAHCGASRHGEVLCPACGTKMAGNMRFCPGCGKKVGAAKESPAECRTGAGMKKKIAILGSLIAVLAIAIAVVMVVGQKKSNDVPGLPVSPQETAAVLESVEIAPELPEEEESPEETATPEPEPESPEELPAEEERVKPTAPEPDAGDYDEPMAEEGIENASVQEETDLESATKRAETSLPLVEITYNGDGEVSGKTEYTYDVSGNLLKEEYYSISATDEKKLKKLSTYVYDEKGNLLREDTEYSNGREPEYTEYKYDSDGVLVETVEHDDLSDVTSTYEYEYDKNGIVVKRACHSIYKKENNEESHVWAIETFDSNGNLLTDMVYDGVEAEEFFHGYTYEYDAEGRQVVMEFLTSDGSVEAFERTQYNSDGNVIEVKAKTANGEQRVHIITYEYDSEGRLVQRCSRYDDGEEYGRIEYKYDGESAVEYTVKSFDEEGEVSYGELVKQTLDANGNVIAMITCDLEGVVDYIEYWTYDEYGNELTYEKQDEEGNITKRREYTYIYFD